MVVNPGNGPTARRPSLDGLTGTRHNQAMAHRGRPGRAARPFLPWLVLLPLLLTACSGVGPAAEAPGFDSNVREACHAVQLHPRAREIKRSESTGVPGQMPEWRMTYEVNGVGPGDVYGFVSDALQRQGWRGIGFVDGVTSLATVAERGQPGAAATLYPELAGTRPGLAYVVGVEGTAPTAPLTVRIRCQDRQLADGVRLK